MQHDYLKRISNHYEAAIAIHNMLPAENSPRSGHISQVPSLIPAIDLNQTLNFKVAPNFTSRVPLL
jgi:hypothetical protein